MFNPLNFFPPQTALSVPASSYGGGMVAPISGDSPGLVRAQVSHGVRQVGACQNIVGISHVGACQPAGCIRQFRCREY